jgi:HlyD family secretion protein
LNSTVKKWAIGVLVLAAVAALILFLRRYYPGGELDRYIASANGRIEATEIDIAAKIAGRVKEILVDEGGFVQAGQVLARMDTAVLAAQLREAKARRQQAEDAVHIANSVVVQRQWEKKAAQAVVEQRQAEVEVTRKRLRRSQELAPRDAVSQQKLEDDHASFLSAKAMLRAAEADLARAEVAIATAKLQVQKAQSDVEAYQAMIERIQADIDDNVLISPRDGRVQYRVAEPGEVLSPGGVVLNLVDLADVYMTFFLPTAQAGRVALGAEAHLVLDAAPQYVIPAEVTFVADVAQFTPKTVETAEERQKLMFRIKARIDPELLKKYLHQVKTGLPGMAYVRLDPRLEWPPELQVRLPQ